MNNDIDIFKAIKSIVDEVSGFLRDHYGLDQYNTVIGKNVMGDLTRRIDIMAEEYAIDMVSKTGLKTWVLSEEKGLYKLSEKPEYIILLDPLDGSMNYVSQIPFAAVSIAVYKMSGDLHVYRRPLYGVVENVFTKDIYETHGNTVLVNNVKVNKYLDKGHNVFSIYFDDIEEFMIIYNYFKNTGTHVKTRTMGAAALEAIYAALGLINGFIHLTGKLRNIDISIAVAISTSLGVPTYSKPSLEEIKVDEPQFIEKMAIVHPSYESLLSKLSNHQVI